MNETTEWTIYSCESKTFMIVNWWIEKSFQVGQNFFNGNLSNDWYIKFVKLSDVNYDIYKYIEYRYHSLSLKLLPMS